ncbi:hypothetical protein Tco_1518609, partial [Tanacetum coccineum]
IQTRVFLTCALGAQVKKGFIACVASFEWPAVIEWSPYQVSQSPTDHSEDDT